MKFQLGRKLSDLFVTVYIISTLFLRFYLEPQLNGHYLVSIALGAFALLFLWALARSKFINPSLFGLWPGEAEEEAALSEH
ncbi:MAG: hypothetical protein KDD19_03455 [Phaeodactylibacter sp.]|nr:hypothetical protein [Phaeodactylibacter sp.]MCB9050744.1 hypothetical protein [Lewinellaceae bacterium]